MATQQELEDFQRKYNKPVIEGLIVGFSGIDPQEINKFNPEELTSNQISIVNDEIKKRFSELEILIDSGNIDTDTLEPKPTPTPSSPQTSTRTSNHEELEGLQGGNPNDHKHLDQLTYDYLMQLIDELFRKSGVVTASIEFIGKVLRQSTLNEIIDARISEYLSNNP